MVQAASMVSTKQSVNSNRAYSEIVMYKLGVENPAKKTNVLKINQVGRFIIHIVDDLIIVHHQLTQSSLIYDIKMASGTDGYVTYNNPVIKKAKIKSNKTSKSELSAVDFNSNSVESRKSSNEEEFFVSTNASGPSSKSSSPMSSTGSQCETQIYSQNWIFFLPNVIIDTRLCCFWFLKIRLCNIQTLNELNNDIFSPVFT